MNSERDTKPAFSPDDVWTVKIDDPDYPESLKAIETTPPVIYGIGNREAFTSCTPENTVSIVGTRRGTAYGREVTYSTSNELATRGVTIVSGMRLGIDGAAHRGALQANGTTIAVTAGGPDEPYPRSHRLLHAQIAEKGCIISENPPGYKVHHADVVNRQRIIAALAGVTVFTEGTTTSLGRTAALFAQTYGLPLAAVPGPVTSPMSASPNDLLAKGLATVVQNADDVQAILNVEYAVPSVSSGKNTINIKPTPEEGMRVIDRLIGDGAYFQALNLAVSFDGTDALAYARSVADRCVAHRDGVTEA